MKEASTAPVGKVSQCEHSLSPSATYTKTDLGSETDSLKGGRVGEKFLSGSSHA